MGDFFHLLSQSHKRAEQFTSARVQGEREGGEGENKQHQMCTKGYGLDVGVDAGLWVD
jgi:hypothetical protein